MNTLFFKHDLGARNDPKLLRLAMRHGMAGIGTYWCLVEMMYEQGGSIPVDDIDSIAYSLRVDVSIILDIVEIGLFEINDDHLTNSRIREFVLSVEAISSKRKAAINARWAKHRESHMNSNCSSPEIQMENKSDTNVLHMNNTCNTEKRKEEIENKKENNKEKAKPSRFVPPTLSEVSDYISSMGYRIDPEHFIAYYESNGWMVGRNRMKSWKAALTNWEKKNNERNIRHNGTRTDTERNSGRSGGGSPDADYPSSL